MIRRVSALLLLVAMGSPLLAQDAASARKLRELASLPVGLTVEHSPSPVQAMRGGPGGDPYTWVYRTTVAAARPEGLIITEYGVFLQREGTWRLHAGDADGFTPQRFNRDYGCPKGRVVPGTPCTDPRNWTGAATLRATRARWYFIGVTPAGTRFKGEGEVEQAAELAPGDPVNLSVADGRPLRIALESVALPPPLDGRHRTRDLIDSLLTAQLLGAGYMVVPPDSTTPLRRQAADSVGGLYDPVTGDVDSTKAAAAELIFTTLLVNRLKVDYVLSAAVVPEVVPFQGGTVAWNGTTQKTGGRSAYSGGHKGRLGALSLLVALDNVGALTVYTGLAGIELSTTIANDRLVHVPADSLLTNLARLESAARNALSGLPKVIPPRPTD